MRIKAAVLEEFGEPLVVTDVDLAEPKQGEVRIAFAASGMCHSDEHLQSGDSTGRLPLGAWWPPAGEHSTGRPVQSAGMGSARYGPLGRGVALRRLTRGSGAGRGY